MTELDAMLAAIIATPCEDTLWLALADFLDEHEEPLRAELIRLHRKLLATCCEPEHPERAEWQARMVELLIQGVEPRLPRKTLTLLGGVPMTFSFVPPGSFLMGGNILDSEKPVHKVTLTKGFYLGVHPVTQEQWNAVMGSDPSSFKGPKRPVENVSWFDCQEFCEKVTAELKGGRAELPTEAEREYACRAGTTSEYHFGDVLNTDLANYYGKYSWNDSPEGNSREATTDVCSFPCNAWGLSDLHGNVWEWCQDAFDRNFYQSSSTQDPICDNFQENRRVLRGGSWDDGPHVCRAASRYCHEPAYRHNSIGFRVCFRPA
jgi:uncharacterized protein (TIGR02996 family)